MPAPLLAISPTKLAPPEAQDAPHANHCEPLACPPNCPSRPSSIAQPSWPMIQAVSESACRSACTAKATSPADSPRLVLCDLGCQAGSNCFDPVLAPPTGRSKQALAMACVPIARGIPAWHGILDRFTPLSAKRGTPCYRPASVNGRLGNGRCLSNRISLEGLLCSRLLSGQDACNLPGWFVVEVVPTPKGEQKFHRRLVLRLLA